MNKACFVFMALIVLVVSFMTPAMFIDYSAFVLVRLVTTGALLFVGFMIMRKED